MNLKKAKLLRKKAMELSLGMPIRELGYKAVKILKGNGKDNYCSIALNRPKTFRAIYRDLKRLANGRNPLWHVQ